VTTRPPLETIMPDPTPIPMLERRRIEAAILKHVYETLKASHGVEVAQRTIADAVRSSSIEQAKEFAARVGGKTSMQTFIDRQALWKAGGGMEMEVKEQTDQSYVFNVTRCRYAEMYREMGLGEIGHLLSCQRDATFCEGYDKRLRLARTQTIMQGASHCDFDYKLLDDAQQS
jgi:L-2-amino-thiazoline-4-carboxylic acid hydrolase-like protein